jgi:hypothetical protein
MNVTTAKMVKLTITNKTGGVLTVRLISPTRSYYFYAQNQGKTKFDILGGKYQYTITTTACSGSISKPKDFRGGGSLGPYVCKKK